MFRKNFIIIVTALVSLSILFFNRFNSGRPGVLGTQKEKKQTIGVFQQIGAGNIAEFHTVEGGTTALELLRHNQAVRKNGEGEKAFITAIDGKQADNSKREFWSFSINGKPSPIGAGAYVLKINDRILWKIEKY